MANEVIPSLSFNHVALKVADFERELRFFTEGLGMKVYAKWTRGETTIALLDMGKGQYIELFNEGGEIEKKTSGYLHLAMNCDDVEAAFNRAIEYGATPDTYPRTVAAHSEPNDIELTCAFVKAPAGELVEFFRINSSVPAKKD